MYSLKTESRLSKKAESTASSSSSSSFVVVAMLTAQGDRTRCYRPVMICESRNEEREEYGKAACEEPNRIAVSESQPAMDSQPSLGVIKQIFLSEGTSICTKSPAIHVSSLRSGTASSRRRPLVHKIVSRRDNVLPHKIDKTVNSWYKLRIEVALDMADSAEKQLGVRDGLARRIYSARTANSSSLCLPPLDPPSATKAAQTTPANHAAV